MKNEKYLLDTDFIKTEDEITVVTTNNFVNGYLFYTKCTEEMKQAYVVGIIQCSRYLKPELLAKLYLKETNEEIYNCLKKYYLENNPEDSNRPIIDAVLTKCYQKS